MSGLWCSGFKAADESDATATGHTRTSSEHHIGLGHSKATTTATVRVRSTVIRFTVIKQENRHNGPGENQQNRRRNSVRR